MKADLHIHTTVSDGRMDPAEAVRLAGERGLEAIALTDHDTDAGYTMLAQLEPVRVAVLPGVEMDTRLDGAAVEILVYGHRPGEGPLAGLLAEVAGRRRRRAEIMWPALRRGLGVELPPVESLFPPPRRVLTRPQIAESLVDSRLLPDFGAALEVVAAYDPGFDPPGAEEAIRAARASGGRCVLAHPLQIEGMGLEALLRRLAGWGLEGVEVDYPYADPAHRRGTAGVRRLAREIGLFETGGSDAHRPEEIGRVTVELPEPLRGLVPGK